MYRSVYGLCLFTSISTAIFFPTPSFISISGDDLLQYETQRMKSIYVWFVDILVHAVLYDVFFSYMMANVLQQIFPNHPCIVIIGPFFNPYLFCVC